MSLLDPILRLVLPPAARHMLTVAEQVPAAVTAARRELDAGHGPVAALRAFSVTTEGQLDDRLSQEVERWLATAIDAIDRACAAGAWLAEHEPRFRSGVDAALATLFGWAYTAAAARDTLRRWQRVE